MLPELRQGFAIAASPMSNTAACTAKKKKKKKTGGGDTGTNRQSDHHSLKNIRRASSWDESWILMFVLRTVALNRSLLSLILTDFWSRRQYKWLPHSVCLVQECDP